ncbi:MAG: hypothetical protein K9I85_05495 [Saprospiraceae bacterium]|nr:hypothetical protein [Saprospiraceae bacterium]
MDLLPPCTPDGSVKVGFTQGNELSNRLGLFASKGRKQVLSVTFQVLDDVPEAALWESDIEALALDLQSSPYERWLGQEGDAIK